MFPSIQVELTGPHPKPIRSSMKGSHEGSQSSNSAESIDIDVGINVDFEENSPFQEGITFRNLSET